MRKEPMPEIGFGNRIVSPIAYLVVFKDYSRFLIFLRIMGPYIVITPRDLQAPLGEIFETRYADR